MKTKKIVAIGGGTGLPMVLEGLKSYNCELTAIVTVTDSGRSSGALRKDYNVLPPGDIRNCLIALSESEKLLQDLFQYRFENGCLEGHSFGNLFIAALSKLTGSFEEAVKEASKILKIKGKVLPSTLEDVHICAELGDGTILEQEDDITRRQQKTDNDAKIKRVFLKPDRINANTGAVRAIEEADLIVIGPGSVYVSIVTNLLINGIREAIKKAKAKKIYICNIMTQPFQSDSFKASDHIKTIIKYLGESVLNYAVLNNGVPSKDLLDLYAEENAFMVENDLEEIKKLKATPILANLIEKTDKKRILWEKSDLLRHDSKRLAKIIMELS
ncbi:YvcK family protein [Candidatus Woesearchaeota archaeon]|nr:YvcK family protein [Candidatus Woesearchaeota archaeon]